MDLSHLNGVDTAAGFCIVWGVKRLFVFAQEGPDVSELDLCFLEDLINLACLCFENSGVDFLLWAD